MSANKTAEATPCWRAINGNLLCHGSAQSVDTVVSIPIMLVLEIGDDHDAHNTWNFPETIRPLSQEAEKTDGLIYEIVGRVFYSAQKAHFVSCFTDNGKWVFDYDDNGNGGRAIAKQGAKVKSYLAGLDSNISLPDDFITTAAVFRLRGGRKAQARFTSDQIAQSQRLHQVLKFTTSELGHLPVASIVGSNIEHLEAVDRYWRINPYTDKNSEYQLRREEENSETSRACSIETLEKLKHAHSKSSDSQELPAPVKKVRLQVNLQDLNSQPLFIPELSENQIASPFPVDCIGCGLSGDGNDMDAGIMIECDICKKWLHTACMDHWSLMRTDLEGKWACPTCQKPPVIFWDDKWSALFILC